MDTDDLSQLAYQTLSIAENTHHLITVHLGVLSKDYKDEDSYLRGMLNWINSINNNPEGFIEEWGLYEELSLAELRNCLHSLSAHIRSTLSLSLSDRGSSDFP